MSPEFVQTSTVVKSIAPSTSRVSPEEFLPGRLPLALRDRLDSVLTQDVADRRVRDPVPQVGEGTLDAVVAPTRVVAGHA